MALNMLQVNFLNQLEKIVSAGLVSGEIQSFPDEIYEKLSHYIFSDIPASIQIKQLSPTIPPGKCFERSWLLTTAFDECHLMRGNLKDLEVLYGKGKARHGWVEAGDWVYDPTSLYRYKKRLYYQMRKPKNVIKIPKSTLLDDERYQKCINGQVNKLSLFSILLLVQEMAIKRNDESFINEVAEYIKNLGYDSIW